jgi:hypothetical protein
MADTQEEEKHEVTIIIDGTQFEVPKGKISYEQVVNYAFDNKPPTGPDVVITVNYSRGVDGKEGSLLPGKDVEVKAGMVFNVKATDKS